MDKVIISKYQKKALEFATDLILDKTSWENMFAYSGGLHKDDITKFMDMVERYKSSIMEILLNDALSDGGDLGHKEWLLKEKAEIIKKCNFCEKECRFDEVDSKINITGPEFIDSDILDQFYVVEDARNAVIVNTIRKLYTKKLVFVKTDFL